MAQKNTLPDTARHTTKYFGCCWRFAGISVPISVTLNGYQNTAEHPQSQQKIRGVFVFMTIAQKPPRSCSCGAVRREKV
jgi:hypothetical protein